MVQLPDRQPRRRPWYGPAPARTAIVEWYRLTQSMFPGKRAAASRRNLLLRLNLRTPSAGPGHTLPRCRRRTCAAGVARRHRSLPHPGRCVAPERPEKPGGGQKSRRNRHGRRRSRAEAGEPIAKRSKGAAPGEAAPLYGRKAARTPRSGQMPAKPTLSRHRRARKPDKAPNETVCSAFAAFAAPDADNAATARAAAVPFAESRA